MLNIGGVHFFHGGKHLMKKVQASIFGSWKGAVLNTAPFHGITLTVVWTQQLSGCLAFAFGQGGIDVIPEMCPYSFCMLTVL